MPSDELAVVLDHLRELADVTAAAPRRRWLSGLRRMTVLFSLAHPSCSQLHTTVTPVDLDGLAAEWHTTAQSDPGSRLLFIHGGGWMGGSLASHRSLVSNITRAFGGVGLAVEYRLAPEHPFPAGLDDCLRAYRWLRDHSPAGPAVASTVAIVGDSAGGNLTLACLLALRDGAEPMPNAAVVMSPLTDFSGDGESRLTRNDVDPINPAGGVRKTGEIYVGGNADILDPLVSPLYGDLHGLPPLLIQVGDAEVMLSDSTMFAAKAEAANVPVTLEVWDQMPHVFQAFAPFLPEANEAIEHTATFLRAYGASD
jgi:monoterpene epsilon-lactone hydrolase